MNNNRLISRKNSFSKKSLEEKLSFWNHSKRGNDSMSLRGNTVNMYIFNG